MKRRQWQVCTVGIGVLVVGASTPVALASPPSAVTVTTLALANAAGPVKARADGVRIEAKVATTVSVQNVVFGMGGRTGWHHHPGAVLVAVQTGAVTVTDSDCHSVTYGPGLSTGAVFTESGDEPMEVSSKNGASVFATLVVPQAVPAVLRIEDGAVACPS